MELRDRIKEMLGKGIANGIVASAVGCDPSYISQLMEDEEFAQEVAVLRANVLEGGIARDANWDALEDAALKKAMETLPYATRLTDIVRIASLANGAKRRATEVGNPNDSVGAPVVIVNLPQSAEVHFQMNRESQVISVGGRSMQALSTQKLAQMAKDVAPQLSHNPQDVIDMPLPVIHEKKKVMSILEQIGMADTPVPVQNVMERAA